MSSYDVTWLAKRKHVVKEAKAASLSNAIEIAESWYASKASEPGTVFITGDGRRLLWVDGEINKYARKVLEKEHGNKAG